MIPSKVSLRTKRIDTALPQFIVIKLGPTGTVLREE